ncbi:MAG: hypothetical protein RLZZ383_2347 [Pseudomonadota bacterium]
MKEKCFWLADWADAEALAGALRAWADAFNQPRPHQALQWEAPAERRQALIRSLPRKAAWGQGSHAVGRGPSG